MRKSTTILICLILLFLSGKNFAGDVTFLQLFHIVKQVFPETQNIALLLAKEDLNTKMTKINRAAAMTQLKVKVHTVDNSFEIGKEIKRVKDKSILVVGNSELFNEKKTKLYILSKCKEKEISLITSSRDYVESGALLGLVKSDDGKSEVMLNLKHYAFLREKFTDEFKQEVNITELNL
jgi:hypothetical protein